MTTEYQLCFRKKFSFFNLSVGVIAPQPVNYFFQSPIIGLVHIIKRNAIDAKHDGSFKTMVEINKDNAACEIMVELFDLSGKKVGETFAAAFGKHCGGSRI